MELNKRSYAWNLRLLTLFALLTLILSIVAFWRGQVFTVIGALFGGVVFLALAYRFRRMAGDP